MSQASSTHLKQFGSVCTELNYKQQACFFLNAYWKEHSSNAEFCFTLVNKFNSLDKQQMEEGTSLDEFESAQLLESFEETMTVIARRKVMREIDINTDHRMSLLEYCVWKFKLNIDTLMTRPQGTNEELLKAEAALKEVQDEIKAIENKKKELQLLSKGTGVKAMRAKNELAQLLSQDPLNLNRLLITAEAAVRKCKKTGGSTCPNGTIWFMEREIEEAKKYKPKGGLKTAGVFKQ